MKHMGSRRAIAFLRRRAVPLTVLAIILLLVLNVAAAALTEYKTLYVDLTPEGLYTLSDKMVEECAKIDEELTITFCDDPDRLLSDYELRYIYIMALSLAEEFDNIKVETHNLTLNPTALDRFRTTTASSLKTNNVIVSCGDRYRIYNDVSFWLRGDEDGDEDTYWSYNGEYTMATAFFSLAAVGTPVVYFTTGHGESFYVDPEDTANAALPSDPNASAFYDLIIKGGLQVGYLDLSAVDAVPSDCAMVVINAPTSDFKAGDIYSYMSASELEKLDKYLAGKSGAVMLFKDPSYTLPNLEVFAEKWGISYVNDSIVKDNEKALADATALYRDKLISEYTSDETSYSWGVYRDISSIDTAPAVIVEKSGSILPTYPFHKNPVSGVMSSELNYSEFLLSSESARAYAIEDGTTTGVTGQYTLAALTTMTYADGYTGERYYSYFFGGATSHLTTNAYLADPTYANADVMFALIRYMSGINSYADVNLGSTSFNSENVGGKRLQHSLMEATEHTDYSEDSRGIVYPGFTSSSLTMWSILLFIIPVVIVPCVCAVVCIRRKYL